MNHVIICSDESKIKEDITGGIVTQKGSDSRPDNVYNYLLLMCVETVYLVMKVKGN